MTQKDLQKIEDGQNRGKGKTRVTSTKLESEETPNNAREWKRLSRANVDANSSRQKPTGEVKEKKRKRKSRNEENLSPPLHCTTSAFRIMLHRARLKAKTETLTRKRKVAKAKKSVTAALKTRSPATRSSVLNVSLTPKT